jgi:pSer/pThr/pTyr-binding forkhead associated (FHA) protein
MRTLWIGHIASTAIPLLISRACVGIRAGRSGGPRKKGVRGSSSAFLGRKSKSRLGRLPAFSCLADRLAVYGDISGKHAVIRVSELDVVIIDVGSSNGTFVNDRRVPEYQEIHIENDDTIRFANSLIVKVTTADE